MKIILRTEKAWNFVEKSVTISTPDWFAREDTRLWLSVNRIPSVAGHGPFTGFGGS